jgi:hypothetical protein
MQTGWHDPVGRDCWSAHTLRQAAAKMAIHSAGAAVVLDPGAGGTTALRMRWATR